MSRSSAAGSGATRLGRIDPVKIATHLAPAVRWPGVTAVARRSWQLVLLTPEIDAWLIAWPSGGRVELHDHGPSMGAIVVLEGELTEVTPWRDDVGRLCLERRELGQGAALRLPYDHVHDVMNETATTAISLHVYHPPLSTMNRYSVVQNQLLRREMEQASEWQRCTTLEVPTLRLPDAVAQ